MKFRIILTSAVFAWMGLAMPAFAQAPAPQAEAVLQGYINSHPEVRRDPSLLDNPGYLSSHPEIAHFIRTHPYVHRQTARMGAFDSHHQWRDTDWWHQNNPNWVYQNHRDWIEDHPQWMNDGDYDDTRQWRTRQWWRQNHPEWVEQHHPHWAAAHGIDNADDNGPGRHGKGHAYGHDKEHGHGHGKD